MDNNSVYFIGDGCISKQLAELGMHPLSLGADNTVSIPKECKVLLCANLLDDRDWCEKLENADAVLKQHLLLTGRASLACLDAMVPMVLVSNESVFGEKNNYKENSAKNPKSYYGTSVLTAEAITTFDKNRVIRTQSLESSAILWYLENLSRMPRVLHLPSSPNLNCNQSRKLGYKG